MTDHSTKLKTPGPGSY